jgi:hypothetical protein
MVRFTEFALAGLKNVTENDERAEALRHSISLHLSNNGLDKSVALPRAPEGKLLYLFWMGLWRITWELQGPGPDDIMVWSVGFLSTAK